MIKARARSLISFFTIALLMTAASLAVGAGEGIEDEITPGKGSNDPANYRYLELANGMGALLISDPRADKAAAGLDVHVGAGADPENRAGLAHFTEHMLFLGTETYPDPGEYKEFINSHGGSHNAYTSSLDTNYFFDVEPQFLEPALDRFSEQFRVPTFAEELVERERNAVNSEFSAHLRDDNRRFWSALRETFTPGHRLAGFTVGNLETLSNENGELREDTIAFYRNHYSANLMKLVVIGPQSLDELASMVIPRFRHVDNRDHQAPRYTTPFFDPSSQPRLLKVKSLRDKRNLQLTFPIASTEDDYRNKPLGYLSHLIGHEGPGSLHAVLKKAGLVDKLSAGQSMDTGEQAMMNISLSLTPEGLTRWKDVVSMAFAYLRLIREEGIRQAYFEEQQQLNDIDLRFRERSKPVRQASTLASRLQRVEPADAVIAPWLYETYEPSLYRELLAQLTPETTLVSILAPFDGSDTEKWERTRYYDTPHQVTDLDPTDLAAADAPSELKSKLTLPEPNPFVPQDLSLVSGPDMEHPQQLNNGPLELWFSKDRRFDTPRANVYLSLRSPGANGSPRDVVLTELLAETVNDELNALAYPARIAGLDYEIYSHLRGITVRVSGYNDKLPQLLHEILLRLRYPVVDADAFRTRLRELQDELGNAAQRRPYEIAISRIQERLMADVHPHAERLEATQGLAASDLRAHADSFYQRLDPVMLVHGNMTRAAALNLQARSRHLIMDDAEHATVPRSRLKRLAQESQTLRAAVRHSDQGYIRYIQGNDKEYQSRALYTVLAQVLSAPFYESLRTRQQMGYIVNAAYYPIMEVPALAFIVQSPDNTSEEITNSVGQFLEQQEERLGKMSEQRFERQKQAVISQIAEDETQLSGVAERYWQEIDRNNHDFDDRERLISAVESLSRERMIEAYRKEILGKPRQLIIDANNNVPRSAREVQRLQFDGRFRAE